MSVGCIVGPFYYDGVEWMLFIGADCRMVGSLARAVNDNVAAISSSVGGIRCLFQWVVNMIEEANMGLRVL